MKKVNFLLLEFFSSLFFSSLCLWHSRIETETRKSTGIYVALFTEKKHTVETIEKHFPSSIQKKNNPTFSLFQFEFILLFSHSLSTIKRGKICENLNKSKINVDFPFIKFNEMILNITLHYYRI